MSWATAIDLGVLGLGAFAAFWPVFGNGFVNWDDPIVLVDNPHLATPGVAAWAFSTTLIGHYQPLAWLAWSAVKSQWGLSASAFHGLSVAVHVANGVLVYALALRLCDYTGLGPFRRRAAGLVAASIFLLHPTSVEAVAWASAFPYVLSTFALLLSFLAYVGRRGGRERGEGRRLSVSVVFYALSLLARATALGYPLVLFVVDLYPLKRHHRASLGRLILEKTPFVALATAAAVAEWRSRDVTGFQEIGLGSRAMMATTAPFVYIWRSLWPARLSPLHPLPISPTLEWPTLAIGIAGMVAVTTLAWGLRERWSIVGNAWVIYLLLLAPVAGLTPTGLQATADRYMYVPCILVAIVGGVAVARLPSQPRCAGASRLGPKHLGSFGAGLRGSRWLVTTGVARTSVAIAATGVLAMLGVLTWQQTRYWRDSITLWTRATALDPRNDVAAYNLAVALADSGREEEAIGWYERTLLLVPDHDLARRNLAILEAARVERNADRLAAEGRAREAAEEYARALSLDARRAHARAAHGILMLKSGRLREALADLRLAIDDGVSDVEVPNALAFALVQTGETAEAAGVLARAVAHHPDNINLKHNLARLLATAADPQVRDGSRALRLALEVCEQTANRDPRALDTLSAAYAATGRLDMARATAKRAEARARELGDAGTAAEIAAHARSYRR